MNIKLDMTLLRPLLVPAIFLGIGVGIWLLLIPDLIDRHDEIVNLEAQLEGERQTLQTQLNQRRNDLRDLAQFQANYEKLVAQGFAAPQNRLDAARTLERLAGEHKLNSAKYTIAAETVLSEAMYRPGDLETVSTSIELTLSSVLERSIVAYLQAVQQALPGQVTMVDFRAEKAAMLTPQAEQDDATSRRDFVRAYDILQWRTVRQRGPAPPPRTGP